MSPELYSITYKIQHLFRKKHGIIFFAVISLLFAAGLYFLMGILTATNPETPSNQNLTNFDKETIEHIKTLRPSSNSDTPLEFPEGRISPFSE